MHAFISHQFQILCRSWSHKLSPPESVEAPGPGVMPRIESDDPSTQASHGQAAGRVSLLAQKAGDKPNNVSLARPVHIPPTPAIPTVILFSLLALVGGGSTACSCLGTESFTISPCTHTHTSFSVTGGPDHRAHPLARAHGGTPRFGPPATLIKKRVSVCRPALLIRLPAPSPSPPKPAAPRSSPIPCPGKLLQRVHPPPRSSPIPCPGKLLQRVHPLPGALPSHVPGSSCNECIAPKLNRDWMIVNEPL